MPCFERYTDKRKQAWNFSECSLDLYFLLTVLTSPCLQHQLFISFWFTFSRMLWFQLKSLPISLYSLHLRKCHPYSLTTTRSTSLNLLRLPEKIIQSSSTIFSHISSFSLRFFEQIKQFYTVFRSGKLYVFKSLNVIAAPVILKN